jgi:hypothetical protein
MCEAIGAKPLLARRPDSAVCVFGGPEGQSGPGTVMNAGAWRGRTAAKPPQVTDDATACMYPTCQPRSAVVAHVSTQR